MCGISDTYIPRKLYTAQRTAAGIDSLTIYNSNIEVLDFFYRKIKSLALKNNPYLNTVRGYWWQDMALHNVVLSGNPRLQPGESLLNNSIINRTTDLYQRLDAQPGWIWPSHIENLVIDGPVHNEFL